MREIRLSGSEGGEAETTGLPYPYLPAQGNALGKGKTTIISGPTGQQFQENYWPVGPIRCVPTALPRALP
jgi:hypothetical protein